MAGRFGGEGCAVGSFDGEVAVGFEVDREACFVSASVVVVAEGDEFVGGGAFGVFVGGFVVGSGAGGGGVAAGPHAALVAGFEHAAL